MNYHPLLRASSLALAIVIAVPVSAHARTPNSPELFETSIDAQRALASSPLQAVASPARLETSKGEVAWSRDGIDTTLRTGSTLSASTSIDSQVEVGLSVSSKSSPDSPTVTRDGTTVLLGEGNSAANTMQILDRGAIEASYLIAGPDSPESTNYSFSAGVTPVLQKTGAVALYKADELVGVVEQPVSHDASGTEVDTRYAVKGNALVQTVDATPSSQYPIVAQAALAVFYTRGDFVHVTRGQASGHGWWTKGTTKATKAKVTVQLQYKPKKSSSWNNRGKGVRTTKPGTSKRANARMTCKSLSRKQWRSWVDVDLIGYLDSPNKLYTEARTLKCTL